jgi:hypothetical protein
MTKRQSKSPLGAVPPRISLKQRGGWREAFEAYGAAMTMAEAGEGDLARQIIGQFHAEHRKILVLAQADGVPGALAEYSVNLAERLGFDLVLLSVGKPTRAAEGFEAAAGRGAEILLELAARRGVACAHIIRQGGRDETLNAVSLELRRVEFVITDRLEAERRQATLMVPEFSFRC